MPQDAETVTLLFREFDLERTAVCRQLGAVLTVLGRCQKTASLELRRFWHAVAEYLGVINGLLGSANLGGKGSAVALPAVVCQLIAGYAQYQLQHTDLESSSESLTRTETDKFLGEEGDQPSEVSNRAWKNNSSEAPVKPPTQLIRFADAHRLLINNLIRWDPQLLEGSFKFMSRMPRLIDFEFKLRDFRHKINQLAAAHTNLDNQLELSINRQNRFIESFFALRRYNPAELRGPIHVRFKGEEGTDAGGLTREWFQLLAEDIVNPDYGLFIHSSEGMTFQPNPHSAVNPEHLAYFRFVGHVVGLAVMHEVPLDVHFTRSLYRHMIGLEPCMRDLESIDPEMYSSMGKLLKLNLDEVDVALDFTITCERFGEMLEVELIPNGHDQLVNNANKKDYIRKRCAMRMTKQIESQLLELLSGFYEVIPRSLISVFTEQELETRDCRSPGRGCRGPPCPHGPTKATATTAHRSAGSGSVSDA